VRYNDRFILFTAFNGTHYAWWATDGTPEGTFEVAELPQNGDPKVPVQVLEPFLHEKRLYFGMNDGLVGMEPWVMELGDSLSLGVFAPIIPLQKSLFIAPNPTQDVVHLRWLPQVTLPDSDYFIQILNIQGQVQQEQIWTRSESAGINLRFPAEWPDGTYFVRVMAASGRYLTTERVVLSR
jgi:hypothetical protein